MKHIIEMIKQTRRSMVEGLNGFTIDQLNKIPTGFNNNIIWNLGHVVAVQQDICYTKAGLSMKISEVYYEKYKRDSKPEGFVDGEELELIKKLHMETLDQLVTDYQNGSFKSYGPFTTRTGVDIKTVEDAIHFVPYHEGLHGGVIMTLKRLVKQ